MSARAEQKGLDFSISYAPGLPEAVFGDPTRMRQILMNFISNAVKFTSKGSIHVRVGSTASADGEVELRFEIEDTGIGIAEADLAGVFEKFSQADSSTSRKYGGTGLGLPIARQLAELMQGAAGVESVVGKGSCFWFTAHCQVGRVEDAVALLSESSSELMNAAAMRPLKILVAEDHPINQEIARDILEHLGHSVDLADNGVAAIRAIDQADYDLVLMDIHMPKMDGAAATRAICERSDAKSGIPIIALTADAMVGDREKYIAAGMNGYVSKPFTPDALIAAINQHVLHKGPIEAAVVEDPAPAFSGSALDEAIAGPLRERKPELWLRIAGLYLASTPEALNALENAIAANDIKSLRLAAHTLKAASANIGAVEISGIASSLEKAADDGDTSTAPAALLRLQTVYAAVAVELSADVENANQMRSTVEVANPQESIAR